MFKLSSTEGSNQKPPVNLNDHVAAAIARASTSKVSADAVMETNGKIELNSHTNMVVVGRHAYILKLSGRTAQVSSFNPEYESLKEAPIVDAAFAYDCPVTDNFFILVFHNDLSVLSMERNLVPPLILREAAVEVNDTPKIRVKDPTIHDHCI